MLQTVDSVLCASGDLKCYQEWKGQLPIFTTAQWHQRGKLGQCTDRAVQRLWQRGSAHSYYLLDLSGSRTKLGWQQGYNYGGNSPLTLPRSAVRRSYKRGSSPPRFVPGAKQHSSDLRCT